MKPPRSSGKIPPSAFAAVIHAYLASPKFASLGPATQESYRRYLRIAERPDVLGALPVGEIRPYFVQQFLDGMADRPGSQICARVAIKALERWALVRGLLPHPITTGAGGYRLGLDADFTARQWRTILRSTNTHPNMDAKKK